MQKQSIWASAVLGALWLAVAPSPATAQEGRPAGSEQERDKPAPPAQPQRGGVKPAGEGQERERAQPAERPATDRVPQGQPGQPASERGLGRPTDAGKGLAPADRLAQIEMKHASMTARIERLMELAREKGDKDQLLELEQLRDRAKNKHEKSLAELERELGPERYRAARAEFNEKQGGNPSERGAEMRSERAPAGNPRETDAAQRGEQARKEQARKQQAGNGPTDQTKDKPARPPAGGKPADKPADKPAEKPGKPSGERDRDGGAS